ncbi:hypothetical protein [Nostoc sp. LPT]|nr:hypothetical protein [Nostoc sp. LPT]MBN4006894.1 hypothetical protein [Nostoc sp. LPT]
MRTLGIALSTRLATSSGVICLSLGDVQIGLRVKWCSLFEERSHYATP